MRSLTVLANNKGGHEVAAAGFPLLGVLASAAMAMPAWGQTAGPTSSGAQSAVFIPGFSGVWAKPYVGDYTNPILKPEAAEIVRKHGEMSLDWRRLPEPSGQH